MTQGAAAFRGFVIGAVGTSVAGAIWGGISKASICCRQSDVLTGAVIGGIATMVVYAIPAGVIGALVVAYFASLFKIPDPASPQKPDLHPLDD